MLDLSYNNQIHDVSVGKLLAAPFAGKLKLLELHGTDITMKAGEKLVEAQIAREIRVNPAKEFWHLLNAIDNIY